MELRQGTQDWESIANKLAHALEFLDDKPTFGVVLQTIKDKIFIEILVKVVSSH